MQPWLAEASLAAASALEEDLSVQHGLRAAGFTITRVDTRMAALK